MDGLLKKAQLKWSILPEVLPIVILVCISKAGLHLLGYDTIDLNTLFTTLVGGVVFLLGFLIAGVLSDYKESEKIPSQLSSSCEALFDHTFALLKGRNSGTARQFIEFQKLLIGSVSDWFYEKETTSALLGKIGKIRDFLAGFVGEGVEASYVTVMENDQNELRKALLRAATIRDTEFVAPAYAIVEAMGLLITTWLLFVRIEPFASSLFCTALTPLFVFYVLLLLRDLDNPFDYSTKRKSGTEISLEPIREWLSRVTEVKL